MSHEVHPVSRNAVLVQKFLSVVTQVLVLNIFVVLVDLLFAAVIGEEFQMREFLLMHTAYLLMQFEIASICFGISAFIQRGSIGIGLGCALALYFMNLICNISEKAEFLKYITPYAYSDASQIISESKLEGNLIVIGMVISLAGIGAAFFKYNRKDILA